MKPIKQFETIDVNLLKKYSAPGPRYTSYPTAPVFSPTFTADDYEKEILRTNKRNDLPLSLYFHIPFCDTLCYFCGCNMLITRDREKINGYVQYLKREMAIVRSLVHPDRVVDQLAWGGGTPTYLNPDEILDLALATKKLFPFTSGIEAAVELDPRGMTKAHLEALYEGGFNRASMGLQDFNEEVQRAVNRIQPEDMTRQVIDWAREVGFESLNLDLIYGLPHQTMESFEETLDRVIEINPDRFAVFHYAHVPWLKKHMALIHEEDLPSPETKLRILVRTIEKLNAAGYVYIGMDHFAKPDNELAIAQATKTLQRNFQGYSTKAGADLYGFGMTAISQFDRMYAQNMKTLAEYYPCIDDGKLATHVGYTLSDDDVLRRNIIMKLMCDFELDKRAVEQEYAIHFDAYFADALEQLRDIEADGCICLSTDTIEVVNAGKLIIRNIAMAFDAYLPKQREKQIFSKTV